MLYLTDNKNEIYIELVNKLKAEGSKENIRREIEVICEECRPSSPVICIELCPIWQLKREFHDVFKALEKRSLSALLRITKNRRRLRILEALIKEPYSLKTLKEILGDFGYHHSFNTLRNFYIKPLVEMGFVKKDDGLYKITPWGENAYNILTKIQVAEIPINSKGYDEQILLSLLSGSKSYDELLRIVPQGSLYRSLKRLQSRNLILKSNLSSRIFYFRAKRRPTRKLSPTGLKLFKALPKEGISAKDLSEKIGISLRRVYTHLRRLRYKKHVKKEEKKNLYKITDAGRSFVESLNVAHNLIQT